MGKMTIQQILMQLAGGMGTSIQIFAVTLVFSLPLGLFINYHVVWSVKYRRKILSAEIEIYLKELVQKIACDKGFTVHLLKLVKVIISIALFLHRRNCQ